MKKIVITGSLGHTGKPLAEELIEKGYDVTVISSNPEKQKDIEELGATPAIGSIEDVNFLISTFEGADSVYCIIPPKFNETDQVEYYQRIGNNYAQAVSKTGIKQIVHLSSYGADLDKGTGFILGSHYVEEILNGLSGVNITHLRPGYFYTNLYGFKDMIKGMGFIGSNYGGEDNMVIVDPRDIANAAAEEFELSTDFRKIRYVASEEITANEIAQILGSAIGNPELKWFVFTDEQMRSGLQRSKVPPHIIDNLVEMGSATHNGLLREDYDLHKPDVMGKVKLEDFAKEFAASF